MKECFDACGDDDAPFIQIGSRCWNQALRSKKHLLLNDAVVPVYYIQSDKWQIKRAEPKVLSAEKIAKQFCEEFGIYAEGQHIISKQFLDILAKTADKNGQLREWLRPEQVELRRVAENAVDSYGKLTGCYSQTVTKYYHELKDELKNLKPPYEKDDDLQL
jgi:hypothetical protein